MAGAGASKGQWGYAMRQSIPDYEAERLRLNRRVVMVPTTGARDVTDLPTTGDEETASEIESLAETVHPRETFTHDPA